MADKIKLYCQEKKLQMSESKTHFMTILSPQKRGALGEMDDIEYAGKTITPSKSERALGMIISNTLGNWGPQVSHVLKQAGRKMRAMQEGGK